MDNPRAGEDSSKDSFAASRQGFTEVLGWLEGPNAKVLSHAELEDQLDTVAGSCCAECSRTT